MIFDVTQIFSGKLNEDTYLFTIKAREKNNFIKKQGRLEGDECKMICLSEGMWNKIGN